MKKILSLLLLLAGCNLFADTNYIQVRVTLTNNPVTGDALAFTAPAATTRTFTNFASALTIATNTTAAGAMTNLFLHFAGNAVGAPRLSLRMVASNSFDMIGNIDQAMAVSQVGTWCTLVFTTNPVTRLTTVRVPIESETGDTNRTNVASLLVRGISALSSNSFGTGTVAMANFADLTSVQTLKKKVLTNGTLTGFVISNATFRATNSFCEDCVLLDAILTNGVNYGSAFSSPGTGVGAEQFGSGAQAGADGATAVGTVATASGTNSTANGAGASATANDATAIGTGAFATGEASSVLGSASIASAPNSAALGANTAATHTNSTAIGTGAATTANNQIMLGTASVNVRVNNVLQSGSITNSFFTGTNQWQGDIAFPLNRNSALVSGNNSDIVLTNYWTQLAGPTANFTNAGFLFGSGNRDGVIVEVENTNGFPMAILNQSGLEATPANRVITPTGATLVITGNPGCFRLRYYSDLSRWKVIGYSN